MQSYVTSRRYIISSQNALLTMNSNNISFTNNGAWLTWYNNNSQIYDDSNLHISSVANIVIYTPTQVTVTSPSVDCTSDVYSNNAILASQQWVNNQYFLTASPHQLTVGKLIDNPIVS